MNYQPGDIEMGGCFTGEFGLGDELTIDEAPYVIARDRIIEARHCPFERKLLPLGLDVDTERRTAGGYYLLPTFDDASAMCNWYQDPVDGMIVDGVPMLQRQYFKQPLAHCWHVLGAEDFSPLETHQHLVRFQRWRTPPLEEKALREVWPVIREAAIKENLASTWLLANPQQDENLALITTRSRSVAASTAELDFSGMAQLSANSGPGDRLSAFCGVTPHFDRVSLIFSIWFPYTTWQDSKAIIWPNSPPLPGLQTS